jgi:hypothetical protein
MDISKEDQIEAILFNVKNYRIVKHNRTARELYDKIRADLENLIGRTEQNGSVETQNLEDFASALEAKSPAHTCSDDNGGSAEGTETY